MTAGRKAATQHPRRRYRAPVTTPATAPASMNSPQMRHILFSSFMGSAIEFYDFLLYALATSLVFDKVFFNNLSPGMATVAGFATFAAIRTWPWCLGWSSGVAAPGGRCGAGYGFGSDHCCGSRARSA